MPRVRVREAGQARSERAQLQEVTLQPLQVAGIVVRKADIIRALRVYVPGLTDVQVTEDGEPYVQAGRGRRDRDQPHRGHRQQLYGQAELLCALRHDRQVRGSNDGGPLLCGTIAYR